MVSSDASDAAPASERGCLNAGVRRARRRDVVAQRQLQTKEILKDGGKPRAPRIEVEFAQVDAVDLDGSALGVIQAAQEFRDRRLASAVLSDDGERRPGGNGQIQTIQHRRAARIGKRHVAESNLPRGSLPGGSRSS